MDYGELQFSLKDVRDNLGKPMIRLIRFEWTCIGKNNSSLLKYAAIMEGCTLSTKVNIKIKEQTNY